MSKIIIRRAEPPDLSAVAQVHMAAFRGFFLAELGPRFLRAYYRTVLEYQGGHLLVAESDGHVAGFVAGFIDPVQFYRQMSERKWRFAPSIVFSVLRNPRLLGSVLVGTRRVASPQPPDHWPRETACELSSVAVDPRMGGQGVGGQLVSRFVDTAVNCGAEWVYLTTDAVDNETVNAFYTKCGFLLTKTLAHTEKRPMNVYVIEPERCVAMRDAEGKGGV